MRVALITLYNHYALGARCVAASALKAGHQVELILLKRFISKAISRDDPVRTQLQADGQMPVFEVQPWHDLVCPYPDPISDQEREILFERLDALKPEIIGFSLTSTYIPCAIELSRTLRVRYPHARQVWGGIHPTLASEECLAHADAVCAGEGDEAFLEYLADPTRTDIANFIFKGADGSIIRNSLRPLIQDLDALPFPLYSETHEILIDQDRTWRRSELPAVERVDQVILSSHRGCPFSCTYCLHGVVRKMYSGEKYLRRKSVDYFLKEAQARIEDSGIQVLNLWDDVFMIDENWINEFCEKYPKRIGLPFGAYGHPNSTTRSMLEKLKKIGCCFVSIGIQSGSEYVTRDVYKRTVSVEKLINFGRDLIETGNDVLCYDLLSRCEFEREEDLKATVHLVARLPKPVKVVIKQLTVFPFTEIRNVNLPRPNLSTKIYLFYEMLCLLAAQPGFDQKLLDVLVEDPHLREHPELIEHWVRGLASADNQNRDIRERLARLENQMPWGVKKAAKHLAGQLAGWANRRLGGAKAQ